ncbi:MAG: hypothetical protein KDC87_04030 [Planctomycetes bacterium]|nr:hypothetical protein [Planctomycetota bacterium]MCB9870283.1 hypothetical protein [Planctomycetota bacterium]MCB9888137.1 hypothetical protein [Planctomycetota bacterium]
MTQTEAPKHEHGSAPHGATSAADDHHDPLHDIDGLKTTLGVFGTVLLIVAMIWGMSRMYAQLIRVERHNKIEIAPTIELDEMRKLEAQELAGKRQGHGSISIDDAIQAYLKK